jgi:hypothetical protein
VISLAKAGGVSFEELADEVKEVLWQRELIGRTDQRTGGPSEDPVDAQKEERSSLIPLFGDRERYQNDA